MGHLPIVLSVQIGSKLHGFATEESDDDVVTVYTDPLRKVLSLNGDAPKGKQSHGDDDAIRYELRHFSRLLLKGNPTVYEVVFSNLIYDRSWAGNEIQHNIDLFLDDVAIYHATRGYVYSTMKEANTSTFSAVRRGKKALASLRVLRQGEQMLKEGRFEPYNPRIHRDYALRLKAGDERTIDMAKVEVERMLERFDAQFEQMKSYRQPNTAEINQLLYDVYMDPNVRDGENDVL